jgi:serine/threonine protein kinase
MSTTQPPQLPGYRFVDLIDAGGFAEVFRYHDERIGRDVAVKVLSGQIEGQSFIDEARIMAKLGGHPNIVTIFDQGATPAGRPYLIMEYCPPPNLKQRAEQSRLPIELILDVGIAIAGAVETAHLAGILHRDIKPANILINGFGDPLLTDFGLSSVQSAAKTGSADGGISLPWAALEAVEGWAFDARSDVYALAATLYTLTTGRWPFEIVGQRNGWDELVHRQRTQSAQPMNRPDAPRAFEDLLRRAMSADPMIRPQSALAFGNALRDVGPPGWRPAQLRVPNETADAARRERQVVATFAPGSQLLDHTILANRVNVSQAVEANDESHLTGTQLRPSSPAEPEKRRRTGPIVAAAAAVVALIGLTLPLLLHAGGQVPAPTPTPNVPDIVEPPEAPEDPRWQSAGPTLTVRWQAPDAEPGDAYHWSRLSGNSGAARQGNVSERFATLTDVNPKKRVCVKILAQRGGLSSGTLTTCWPDDK